MRSEEDILENPLIVEELKLFNIQCRSECIVHLRYDDFVIHPDYGEAIQDFILTPRHFPDFLMGEFGSIEDAYSYCRSLGISKPPIIPLAKAYIRKIYYDWDKEITLEDYGVIAPSDSAWAVFSEHKSWNQDSDTSYMANFFYCDRGLAAAKTYCEDRNIEYIVQ